MRFAGNGVTNANAVVRQTRLTPKSFGRFDLACLRHTNRWHTVYRDLTMAESCRIVEEEEVFWPTT